MQGRFNASFNCWHAGLSPLYPSTPTADNITGIWCLSAHFKTFTIGFDIIWWLYFINPPPTKMIATVLSSMFSSHLFFRLLQYSSSILIWLINLFILLIFCWKASHIPFSGLNLPYKSIILISIFFFVIFSIILKVLSYMAVSPRFVS